ncbi:iron-containing alcohol dehydrogenase [archaeon]|nr:MAG: iron-containing alcohol dehydrogenase [archaeon]
MKCMVQGWTVKIACAPNTINSSEMTSLVRNYNACLAPKPQYTIFNHVVRCALIFYDLEIYKDISQDNLVKGAFLMLAHITDMFFHTTPVSPMSVFCAKECIRICLHFLLQLQHTHSVDPNYIQEMVYAIYLCGECWKREGTHLHHYLVDYLHHEYRIAYDDLHLALHAYTAWYNQTQVMVELVEELGSFDLAGLVYDLQYALLPSRVSLLLLGITPAALPSLLNTLLNETPGLVCNPVPITADNVSSALTMACAGSRPTSTQLPKPPFSAASSIAVVLDRFQTCPSPRLKLLLMRAVQAIHSSVKSTQLTVEEFEGLVGYLTRVGQRCVERQEMMMLFDVLGVEALVEDMQFREGVSKVAHDAGGIGMHEDDGGAHKGAQGGFLKPTPGSLLGPFHVANAPFLPNGAALFDQKKWAGEEVYVFRGRVMDTHGVPLPEAVLDIWHSDDNGYYDVQVG